MQKCKNVFVLGAAGEWKICEAIAQVIANCPIQSQSPDEYYRTIAPQVRCIKIQI